MSVPTEAENAAKVALAVANSENDFTNNGESDAKNNHEIAVDMDEDTPMQDVDVNVSQSNSNDSNNINKSSHDNIKPNEIFFSHLKELTQTISTNISDILQLIPELQHKSILLNSYASHALQTDMDLIEPFSDYIQSHSNGDQLIQTQQESSQQTETETETHQRIQAQSQTQPQSQLPPPPPQQQQQQQQQTLEQQEKQHKSLSHLQSQSHSTIKNDDQLNGKSPSNLNNLDLSLQEQSRTNRNYRNNSALNEIPEIELNTQAKTVRDIWEEWQHGDARKNKPPLGTLESKYGTKWRRGRIAKSAQRRKKVIEFIENEFKKHNIVLQDINNVVEELEKYRISRGKGLFWLYGSLPERLYDDNGRPLRDNDDSAGAITNQEQADVKNEKNSASPQKEESKDDTVEDDLVNSTALAMAAQEVQDQGEQEEPREHHEIGNDPEQQQDQEQVQVDNQNQNPGLVEEPTTDETTDPALAKL